MSSVVADGHPPPALWIESLARVSGYDRLLGRLSVPTRWRPIAVLWTVLGVDLTINLLLFTLGEQRAISPGWVIVPIGLTFGLYAALDLRARYSDAFDIESGERSTPISFRYRLAILAMVLAGFYAFWLLQPNYLGTFIARRGQLAGLFQLNVIGICYMLVFADFLAMVASGTVLVPVHVARGLIPIDFSDPTGYAGLRPFGRLVQRAAVYYFVGVILYTIRLFQEPGTLLFNLPGGGRLTLFALVWILGIVLYAIPAGSLAYLLDRHKERRIRELDIRIRDLGEDDLGLPGTDPGDDELTCIRCELEIQRVRNSRKVPVPSNQFIITAVFTLLLRGLAFVPNTLA